MKVFLLRTSQVARRPIFLYFLTPLFITFIGVFLTIFFNPTSKLTILLYPPAAYDTITYPRGELYAKQKIQGKFQAKNDNLGIVSVRFYNFQRISKDKVVFRIKEVGQTNWYYINTYKVDQFQPHELFPFGFSLIPDSKGKWYQFEVESLYGKKKNAIGISTNKPIFTTSYQAHRNEITNNLGTMTSFVKNKTESVIQNPEALTKSIVYFLPLGYYIAIFIVLNKLLRNKPFITLGLLLVITFIDIIFIQTYHSAFYFLVGSLWIIAFYMQRIDRKFFYLLSIAFLILIPLMLIFDQIVIANKLGRWVYIFLVLSLLLFVIQIWRKPLILFKNKIL